MNNYIVLKLTTGEQIMCTLLNESVAGIVVLDPVQIKMITLSKNGEFADQAVTSLFCQFTEDQQFVFKHKDIIFYKELNSTVVPFYIKACAALKSTNLLGEEEPDQRMISISSNYH